MDHAPFVRVGKARGHLQSKLNGHLGSELTPFFEEAIERTPLDQLHGVKVLVPFADTAERTDDIRVPQRLQDFQLALEAGEDGGVGHVGREQLDGDVAIIDDVPRAVHDAHPALAELVEQLERPDPALLHDPISQWTSERCQPVRELSGTVAPILRSQRSRARPRQPRGGRRVAAPSLRDVLTV